MFDFARGEVRSFLLSNACLLAGLCIHADGLRVDAVSGIIYYDFCRQEPGTVPAQLATAGGRIWTASTSSAA